MYIYVHHQESSHVIIISQYKLKIIIKCFQFVNIYKMYTKCVGSWQFCNKKNIGNIATIYMIGK